MGLTDIILLGIGGMVLVLARDFYKLKADIDTIKRAINIAEPDK